MCGGRREKEGGGSREFGARAGSDRKASQRAAKREGGTLGGIGAIKGDFSEVRRRREEGLFSTLLFVASSSLTTVCGFAPAVAQLCKKVVERREAPVMNLLLYSLVLAADRDLIFITFSGKLRDSWESLQTFVPHDMSPLRGGKRQSRDPDCLVCFLAHLSLVHVLCT